MLCLAKLRPGGHAYYLEVVATGAEAQGEWLSAGADLIGLSGVVAADDLAAVLAGADPSSGSRLGRSHDRVKVAGFDLTFCAPKSVNLLHAPGARDVADQVRFGHGEAVREALSYVERSALGLRRGTGAGRTVMPAEAVAAGGFLHRTSRALDPHLHSGREGERHTRPGTHEERRRRRRGGGRSPEGLRRKEKEGRRRQETGTTSQPAEGAEH